MNPLMPVTPEGWLRRLDQGVSDARPFPVTSRQDSTPRPGPPRTGRTIVLVSRDYPPLQCGGIATFVHALAQALHEQGERVHVVAKGEPGRIGIEHDGGVPVHRIRERNIRRSLDALKSRVPRRIWRWSASAFAEVARLAQTEAIDVVEAPIWACEGIAFLLDRRWPLVTSLHTTLHTWMQSNPRKASGWLWRLSYGRPMLALEKRLMTRSDAIRANSHAILREIESAYRMVFSPAHTHVVPHGLLPTEPPFPPRTSDDHVEFLFVGRLEQRKGIGVLLQSLPALMERWPQLHMRIIGDTRIRNAAGRFDMDDFLAQHRHASWLPRVVFEGKVCDERLQHAYANCDVFVGPSLFESFGLVFVEAMRQGKPVIACQAGGMPEVVEHGVTGLLVQTGDAAGLAQAIERLLHDRGLRLELGHAGFEAFSRQFTAHRMALDSLPLYSVAQTGFAHQRQRQHRPLRISYLSAICKRYDAISNAVSQEIGWLSDQGHDVRLFTYSCNQPSVAYTRVRTVANVVTHPFFQSSDLIVCHFGIYFELFDAILAANTKAKILVVFHNITPKAFVALDQHALIDRSFAQMANMQHADRILCVSDTNLEVLRDQGIRTPAQVLPLAMPGTWQAPPHKPSQQDGMIRLLFVGRFVRSKGLADFLEALDLLLQQVPQGLPPLTLSLVGNLAFSDAALVEAVQRHAARLQAEHTGRIAIRMHFGIDDNTKRQMLADADIFVLPTYHEGFCVPIVEAISSGCRVVAYDNSNVPSISRGLAELVPTGDVGMLARQLGQVVQQRCPNHETHVPYDSYRLQATNYAEIYSEARIRTAFLSQIAELCAP